MPSYSPSPHSNLTRSSLFLPAMDRRAFREGRSAMYGPSVGITVWGVVTGVALVGGGLSVPLAVVMTLFPFAGSAQLAALPLLAVNAPLPVIFLTVALVNLRFVIFSAAVRDHFVHLPFWQKVTMAYLNGDIGGTMFHSRFAAEQQRNKHAEHGTVEQLGYYFGLTSLNWLVWVAASLVGILVGDRFPSSWELDFAATLALVAVIIPLIKQFPVAAGLIVSTFVSVMSMHLPYRIGLLIAVLAGVCASFLAKRVNHRATNSEVTTSEVTRNEMTGDA